MCTAKRSIFNITFLVTLSTVTNQASLTDLNCDFAAGGWISLKMLKLGANNFVQKRMEFAEIWKLIVKNL